MATTKTTMTDDIVREIGEQVSQAVQKKFPRWGGTAFDIARGSEMYRGHLGISISPREMSLQDVANMASKDGGAPPDVGVYVLKLDGDPKYVGRAIEDRPGQSTPGLRKRLKEHARGADTSSKDIKKHREEVTVEFYPAGTVDAAKSLEARKIEELATTTEHGGWNKRHEKAVSIVPDVAKRTGMNIATGVASDLALFAVSGAAMEIRSAYRDPNEMSILDRCKRLLQAIWERFKASVKDRSVREIGSEFIVGAASILTAPLKMATAAVERIVHVLRRLWMDFAGGRIKTLTELVSAALKAAWVVASVGIVSALEVEFIQLFSWAGPVFGEMLAGICAAVVAGVMIAVGNRSIEWVVKSLFGVFQAAARARRRREEIEAFCNEMLPRLVEDRERLEALVTTHLAERRIMLTSTFEDLRATREAGDIDGFLQGLQRVNEAYGKALEWQTFGEFDQMMEIGSSLKM